MKHKILFILGILLALMGAALMFFGVWPLSLRITIGIVGLALITQNRKL